LSQYLVVDAQGFPLSILGVPEQVPLIVVFVVVGLELGLVGVELGLVVGAEAGLVVGLVVGLEVGAEVAWVVGLEVGVE